MGEHDGDEKRQPPPLEALLEDFPPEKGWTVEYAEWIEIVAGEVNRIPVAIVRGHGQEITFFPRRPTNFQA